MQEISWGNLPRYFFKEYETGLSINAVALGCKVEMMREGFAPLPCLKEIFPPAGCSAEFASGFLMLKELVREENREMNPVSFLSRALYNSIYCHGIKRFEFISPREELQQKAEELAMLFEKLKKRGIFFESHSTNENEEKKLIILIETRQALKEQNKPSLYALRQKLLQKELPNLTITLADSSEYHIGTLYALMRAAALLLDSIAENNTDFEITI